MDKVELLVETYGLTERIAELSQINANLKLALRTSYDQIATQVQTIEALKQRITNLEKTTERMNVIIKTLSMDDE